ncbi:hypothetical protein L1987_05331 [Smallanthus sonchifolius]|uniref:Uncharacterized protein n=1 Tax=Smallanthus sonchifolius TaxID=185202 RepID=A0ACB9JV32_9ASTR|nr:hypothetical protein L1987_05331 [Smallanthus sonchifolius]
MYRLKTILESGFHWHSSQNTRSLNKARETNPLNPCIRRRLAIGREIMFQPNMYDNLHHHLVDMSHKTPENNLDMLRDFDDHDSNMEAPSSDDQDPNLHPNKKKRYHRHTQHQIQELEAFFKECPHPDDKQRKELGRRLSLEPLQVKFWFQNKRTQMKAQHERYDNTQLRNENEKLRAKNMRLKEALTNATCPNCRGPAAIEEMSFDEQHLRIENAHLQEEVC